MKNSKAYTIVCYKVVSQSHMGSLNSKLGSLLGLVSKGCRTILGPKKGTPNLANYPYEFLYGACSKSQAPQRAQYLLIKEYTFTHNVKAPIIYMPLFLN